MRKIALTMLGISALCLSDELRSRPWSAWIERLGAPVYMGTIDEALRFARSGDPVRLCEVSTIMCDWRGRSSYQGMEAAPMTPERLAELGGRR